MNSNRQEQVVHLRVGFQEEHKGLAGSKAFMISSDRDKVVIRSGMSLKNSRNSSQVVELGARRSVKLNKQLKAKTSS